MVERGRREHPVVTLVHGTYAREAAWTKPDSELSAALAAAGCTVVPFEWSGRNSHHARTLAAHDLADHLRSEVAKSPRGQFWLVAHSHGGNVAVHAAAELRQTTHPAPQISTVALATPFISSRARKPPGWLLFVLLLFGPVLLLTAAVKIWSGPQSLLDWMLITAGGLFAVALLLCLAGAIQHGGLRNWRELVDATHAPPVGRKDLFVVRSAVDEASAYLITGQFIGWIAGMLSRRLAGVVFWGFLIAFTQVSVLVSAPLKLRFGVYVMLYAFPLPGFALVVIIAAMLLASLVFGLDGPFVCMFAFNSAELAPPGEATILQLEPFAPATGGLAHSRLYREEEVIRSVVDVIRGRAR